MQSHQEQAFWWLFVVICNERIFCFVRNQVKAMSPEPIAK
jgi:hypothetical protein